MTGELYSENGVLVFYLTYRINYAMYLLYLMGEMCCEKCVQMIPSDLFYGSRNARSVG